MAETTDRSRRPGRPPRLSREAIVIAAETLVEREGIAALTMRRVADALESSPMALYRHVRDKDELLVLLLEKSLEAQQRPDVPDEPRARLIALWRYLHDALAACPWVVDVLVAGEVMAPSAVWIMEDILSASVACGLSPSQAAAAYRIVWTFTIGELTVRAARAKTGVGPSAQQLAVVRSVDADRLPLLASVGRAWVTARTHDTFPDDLAAVLDGLLATA